MEIKYLTLSELFGSPYNVVAGRMVPSDISPEAKCILATPHRHNHYSVILLQTGQINLMIDFKVLDLKPLSMLVLRPGQVHQAVPTKDVTGWIISFEGELLNLNLRFAVEQSLQNNIVLNLKESDTLKLSCMISALFDATQEELPGNFQKHLLRSLLNALLYWAADILYLQVANSVASYPSRAVEITRNFNQLLKQNFRIWKRPSEYADKMNITVSYLNDTLKAVSGSSCTHTIQKEVICEAQRLLFYTLKSVKEIASELGFQDYKYFIRQFVKVTNTTPLNFRKGSTTL